MAQGKDFYIPFQDGSGRIHGICWEPEETPWAVIQVAHGMIEHIGRYEEFAQAMNRAGIAVIGHDHPGHGRTAKPGELGEFAEKNGVRRVNGAMAQVARFAKHKFQGIPHILLGHSMGSFYARQYLCEYGHELDGAIIMGTGWQPEMTIRGGLLLAGAIAKIKGADATSKLVTNMAFGAYNKAFGDKPRTPNDWLSADTDNVDRYMADPLCGADATVGLFRQMLRGLRFNQTPRNIDKMDKDAPILLIAGQSDPVGDMGAGVRRTHDAFKRAGIKDVTLKLYPGLRHEILNEAAMRDTVYGDIGAWLDRVLG